MEPRPPRQLTRARAGRRLHLVLATPAHVRLLLLPLLQLPPLLLILLPLILLPLVLLVRSLGRLVLLHGPQPG